MPEVGIEPTCPCGRRILSPLRLPISPLWRHVSLVRPGCAIVKTNKLHPLLQANYETYCSLLTRCASSWVIHLWLASVVFHLLFALGGVDSVTLLKVVCLCAAFCLLWRLFWKASGSMYAGLLLALAVFYLWYWKARRRSNRHGLSAVCSYLNR